MPPPPVQNEFTEEGFRQYAAAQILNAMLTNQWTHSHFRTYVFDRDGNEFELASVMSRVAVRTANELLKALWDIPAPVEGEATMGHPDG